MKKIPFLLSTIGAVLLCCCTLFVIYGFDKNDPAPDPTFCNANNLVRQITINFSNPNDANYVRKPGFEGYIPSPDLRFGDAPATSPTQLNSWYCKVTVTSPECPDFEFHYVLENGNQNVNVELPGEASFEISIDYSETFDSPHNPFDFNQDQFGNCLSQSVSLSWSSFEFFPSSWNAGVSQPITLTPGVVFCENGSSSVDVKNYAPQDYTSGNDFIEDVWGIQNIN